MTSSIVGFIQNEKSATPGSRKRGSFEECFLYLLNVAFGQIM